MLYTTNLTSCMAATPVRPNMPFNSGTQLQAAASPQVLRSGHLQHLATRNARSRNP